MESILDNIIQFPIKIKEKQYWRSKLEYLDHMRSILDLPDYIEFLEATTCKESYDIIDDDVKILVDMYLSIEDNII